MKIFTFVKALLPRLDKSTIIEDINNTISELDSIAIPSYKDASDYFKTTKLKAPDNKELSQIFYRNFETHGPKQATIAGDILVKLNLVRDNTDYILKQVAELMEHDIISEGLTAKKAILVRAADSISFISRFSIDVLNYLYVKEAADLADSSNKEDYLTLAPAVEKRVKQNISKFARMLSSYGIANKDFVKLLDSVPEVVVNTKNANSIAGIYKESDIDPFYANYAVGFAWSPIYHLRLTIAEWQANRYKVNQDKKRALELRKLHLQLQLEKKHDPIIEKELNYLQGRIDKIDRYLIEVEDSLKDVG